MFWKGSGATKRIQVDVPIGHRKRRTEGYRLLVRKFEESVAAHYAVRQAALFQALFADKTKLDAMPVHEFVAALVKN